MGALPIVLANIGRDDQAMMVDFRIDCRRGKQL